MLGTRVYHLTVYCFREGVRDDQSMTRRAVVAAGLVLNHGDRPCSIQRVRAQDLPKLTPLERTLMPDQTAVVMVDFQNNFASQGRSSTSLFEDQFRTVT